LPVRASCRSSWTGRQTFSVAAAVLVVVGVGGGVVFVGVVGDLAVDVAGA